jgi:hypothetical protein
MNTKRFEELKQKLSHEADLSEIWGFYMDHFADHLEFIELGQPAQNAYLDAVVHKSCQQIFGREMTITNPFLISIAEHQFFHGPIQVEGRMGGVIYFEDIKIGLLAVSSEFPPTDEVKYSRFSNPIQLSSSNRNDLN